MAVTILLRALDGATLARVAEISGQNVYKCMQCGTCSSVCPMSDSMTITPRQAMLLLQHGHVEPVADSETPWLCASCTTCEVRCPRGIEVPRVMEAIRQLKLRENVDKVNPRAIPVEDLSAMPQIALGAGFRKLTS